MFKADLENVTDLRTADEFRWYLKLRCVQCGEENPKWVYADPNETQEMPGAKDGEAHIVMKCPLCARVNSLEIVDGSLEAYTADHSGTFHKIVSFDCRGVEPFDFDPRVGFRANGTESGTLFDEIDLAEKEWSEFDEKAGESVGIYGVEHQFAKAKDHKVSKHR